MKTPKTEQTIVKGYEEEKSLLKATPTATTISREPLTNPTVNAASNMNVNLNAVIPVKYDVSDLMNYLNSELKRFKEQKEQNIKQTHQLKDNLLILSGAIQMIEHLLIKFQ
jgi:hypothetical protein